MLNIEILEGNYDEIMVFSSTGKLIQMVDVSVNKVSLDVSQLATGVYFIRFVSGSMAFTKRFVKK